MIYLLLVALVGIILFQWRLRFWDKRRMAVLQKLNTPSNPHLGVNHRIVFSLEQLREFFNADTGFLVLQEKEGGAYSMRQVNRKDTCLKEEATPLSPHLAQLLMSFPDQSTAIFSARRSYWQWESFRCYDVRSGQALACDKAAVKKVGAFLGAHFLSIPILCQQKTAGRVFIASRLRPFSKAEADFIFQVTSQLAANINNLETVSRLADEAAEEERLRIARDMHDSIVQPHVGLQMAIEAMRQKVVASDSHLLVDVERLDQMCREGTAELRDYIRALRTGQNGENSLLPAVQRFASKFETATGIEVQVESSPNFEVHDGLAAHVFQMTVEGLSNVHRHTQAESVAVRLGCDKERLLLQIENSGDEAKSPARSRSPHRSFMPRSITERANSLGGTVHVETHPDGRAVVSVDIPL